MPPEWMHFNLKAIVVPECIANKSTLDTVPPPAAMARLTHARYQVFARSAPLFVAPREALLRFGSVQDGLPPCVAGCAAFPVSSASGGVGKTPVTVLWRTKS